MISLMLQVGLRIRARTMITRQSKHITAAYHDRYIKPLGIAAEELCSCRIQLTFHKFPIHNSTIMASTLTNTLIFAPPKKPAHPFSSLKLRRIPLLTVKRHPSLPPIHLLLFPLAQQTKLTAFHDAQIKLTRLSMASFLL
jgi:hypothetical protein